MSANSPVARPLALAVTPDRALVRAALVVGGALVVALTAQWEIPMWPVPMTGQTLGVLVVGAVLGAKLGGASMLTYVAMGAGGLPVFAGGAGGTAHLGGPTIGYLVGFVVAGALMGWLAERGQDRTARRAALAFALGTAVILACGMVGLMYVLDYSAAQAWASGVQPFLVGAVVKGALATFLIPLAWRVADDADLTR